MLFDDQRLLFFDDRHIESSENVRFRLVPPEKKGACLVVEEEWEKLIVRASVVLRWRDEWRLYYTIALGEWNRAMAMAVSSDGVKWERPDLGVVEFNGSRKNNLVDIEGLRPDEVCVFVDPTASDEQRFKFVGEWPYIGMWVMTSADGVRFKRAPGEILKFHLDNHMSVFWDPQISKYRIYCRGNYRRDTGKGGRAVIYAETEDLFQPISFNEDAPDPWPRGMKRPGQGGKIVQPLRPVNRELPTVLNVDELDPPECDLYQSATIHYAPSAYLSFPSIYYHYPPPPDGFINDGVVDIQFASSRDGTSWNRDLREPYVRLDLKGGQASKQMHMLVGAVPSADQVYQYYCGWARTHGEGRTPENPKPKRVVSEGDPIAFRLSQREDGFVCAETAYTGGLLVTKPFVLSAPVLCINIDTSASGDARAALLDENGGAIAGYGLEDCDLIQTNDTRHVLTWRGSNDLSPLAGRRLKLLIKSRSARLFALYPADPAGAAAG